MATQKTLAPTNQVITIDAFQDEKPDYRHVADAEGKLADAVNALNSKMANPPNVAYTSVTGTSQAQFETALTTALNGMVTGEARVCSAYANYSQSLTNGGQGVAFLVKQQSTVWWCFIVYAGGVRAGYYTNNAWTWI